MAYSKTPLLLGLLLALFFVSSYVSARQLEEKKGDVASDHHHGHCHHGHCHHDHDAEVDSLDQFCRPRCIPPYRCIGRRCCFRGRCIPSPDAEVDSLNDRHGGGHHGGGHHGGGHHGHGASTEGIKN